MRNCFEWEHDGERFEACDHTTSIRFLRDPSPGKVTAREVIIERGDPWSIREDQNDVHLMVDAPGSQTIAVMPKGIVSSTVLDWLARVALRRA
jgi:hypothetical protein